MQREPRIDTLHQYVNFIFTVTGERPNTPMSRLSQDGIPFESKKRLLTLEGVRRKVGKVGTFIKQGCFYNSWLIATAELPDHDVKYYEGYAMNEMTFPIHHAWVTIDGVLLDVTWNYRNKWVYGHIPPKWEYFGVNVPKTELEEYEIWGITTPLGFITD